MSLFLQAVFAMCGSHSFCWIFHTSGMAQFGKQVQIWSLPTRSTNCSWCTNCAVRWLALWSSCTAALRALVVVCSLSFFLRPLHFIIGGFCSLLQVRLQLWELLLKDVIFADLFASRSSFLQCVQWRCQVSLSNVGNSENGSSLRRLPFTTEVANLVSLRGYQAS